MKQRLEELASDRVRPTERLEGPDIQDRVFAHGVLSGTSGVFLPDPSGAPTPMLDEPIMTAIINDPNGEIRHYVAGRLRRLVATVLGAPGNLLYRVNALMRRRSVRGELTDAVRDRLPVDHGARVSVRELGAAEAANHYFQDLNTVKAVKLMERRMLQATLEFLRGRAWTPPSSPPGRPTGRVRPQRPGTTQQPTASCCGAGTMHATPIRSDPRAPNLTRSYRLRRP